MWGILYYCFPAYCSNILIKNNSPNTTCKNFSTVCFLVKVWPTFDRSMKEVLIHIHKMLLFLWLNLSAAFVIPATVTWHSMKQSKTRTLYSRICSQLVRCQIRHHPGPAHLVWEVSPLT